MASVLADDGIVSLQALSCSVSWRHMKDANETMQIVGTTR